MSESSDAAEAVDSATVMPLRQTDDGLEVFMVRRHGDSGFMANRYVYPGGTLDADDCTERAVDHVSGRTPEQARERLDEAIDPLRALGLYLAGVRETFEEAGLLLARPRGADQFVDLISDETTARRFERARADLADGTTAITELLDAEDLLVPLERIGYIAHWITPFVENRRYDTRFFAVLAPDRQAPLHDARETTDSGWTRPEAILERNRDGDLQLAPPTLCTLRDLTTFETADDVLDSTQSHRPPTVLPHVEADGEDVTLYLPGDPDYPSDDPRYAAAEPTDGEVTRLRMVEPGVWQTARGRG